MKQSIIITALLAIALTACSKEESDTVVVPEPEVIPAPVEGDTMIVPAPDAAPDAMAPADTMTPADAMAPMDGEAPAPAAQ